MFPAKKTLYSIGFCRCPHLDSSVRSGHYSYGILPPDRSLLFCIAGRRLFRRRRRRIGVRRGDCQLVRHRRPVRCCQSRFSSDDVKRLDGQETVCWWKIKKLREVIYYNHMYAVYSLLSNHKLLIINISKLQVKLVILFREVKDGAFLKGLSSKN